jgi:hypothetical protein
VADGTDSALLKPYANIRAYRPAWKKTLDAYYERVEAT